MAIHRHYVKLPSGNTLSFFVNDDPDDSSNFLLVVDLLRADESGGNEIVRMRVNEEEALTHIDKM